MRTAVELGKLACPHARGGRCTVRAALGGPLAADHPAQRKAPEPGAKAIVVQGIGCDGPCHTPQTGPALMAEAQLMAPVPGHEAEPPPYARVLYAHTTTRAPVAVWADIHAVERWLVRLFSLARGLQPEIMWLHLRGGFTPNVPPVSKRKRRSRPGRPRGAKLETRHVVLTPLHGWQEDK